MSQRCKQSKIRRARLCGADWQSALQGRRRPPGLAVCCVLLLASWAFPTFAQTPLNDLVFTVGTTLQAQGGQTWSYVLLGSPQPTLLAGKRFDVYAKAGYPTNAGSYTLRGQVSQQTDLSAITGLLNQSLALGDDLTLLSNVLNVMLQNISGITTQPLAQKIATAFQVAASDPGTAQTVLLIERLHPGLTLCAGHAFSEAISTTTSYELREVNPATGAPGDVVGRVTVIPGSPIVLPPPGAAFQVRTNDATDHLRIRLRWGTPDELRRLSLLSFGFNVWRIGLADAQAGGYDVNPPTLPAQLLNDPHFTRVNNNIVTATKSFSTGSGTGAADDPADNATVFFVDDNGRSPGTAHFPTNTPPGYLAPPFGDGDQFYYFITARDVLGRDGLVSPPCLAQACRRLPPQAPTGVRVANATIMTNQPRLLVTWQQNTNTADLVNEYWIYRWPNPAMLLTNDSVPLSNRVGVVQQATNADLSSFLDNNPDSPSLPAASNFWYTVRAVSHGTCSDLLSPHSGPAWGVVRQRAAPDATTGDVMGSCGTPVVMFQSLNLLTNGIDTNNWNYRFTCRRRDPGIAWVQFTLAPGGDTIGPVYFPPNGDTVSADFAVAIPSGPVTNSVTCTVGSYYGLNANPTSVQLSSPLGSTQRQEAVFLAGQLLETALNPSDPLLLSLNGSSLYCLPGLNPTPDPSGTVGMTFNYYLGTPMLIQALSNNTWTSLGVYLPDTNGVYWVSYPACLVGPLPPFQGCVVNLPGTGDCAQHVARASDDGPVAPIRLRFRLTPRTKEYRLYRSVDGGPLTLVAQGTAPFDPLNSQKQVVRTDDAMPPSAARLCYFVQVLDENGNGSPMSFLGCKEVKPAKLPTPVLAEPQAAGDTNAPQVALNWFCSTSGVYRFQVKIERADQPGSGLASGLSSSKLRLMTSYNVHARYAGLTPRTRFRTASLVSLSSLVHFDEAQLTPPLGASFGPGPQFTLTANLVPNVPYNLSVAAMDAQGNVGDSSQVWKFTWVPPVQVESVPWPARPMPPVKGFYEDLPPLLGGGARFTGIPASLIYSNFTGFLDARYPVGIQIGTFSRLSGYNYQITYNNGNTNLASYTILGPQVPPDPNSLVLTAISADPARNGQPLLPIVVYRQQVANTNFPHVTGNLVQCSPLLERIPYHLDLHLGNASYITIEDRLIAAAEYFDPSGQNEIPISVLYLRDQQPVIHGATYQYYVVRFTDKREIDEVIPTNPVFVP